MKNIHRSYLKTNRQSKISLLSKLCVMGVVALILFERSFVLATSTQQNIFETANQSFYPQLTAIAENVQENFERQTKVQASLSQDTKFNAWPVWLRNTLNQEIKRTSFDILLTDLNGIIRAELPGGQFAKSVNFFGLLSDDTWRTLFENPSHATAVIFSSQSPHLVSLKLVPDVGMLVILHPTENILSSWRSQKIAELVFLFALSLCLLCFLKIVPLPNLHFRKVNTVAKMQSHNTKFGHLYHFNHDILGQAKCGLWQWNLQTQQIIWSSSLCRLLDLPNREKTLTEKSLKRFLHPRDALLEQIKTFLWDGQRNFTVTFRLQNTRKRWHYFEMRGTFEPTSSHGLPVLNALVFDVTAKEKQAQQVAAQFKRLTDAINITSEAFALWDRRQNLIMCNRKFLAFYHLPEHLVKPGVHFRDVIALVDDPALKAGLLSEKNAHKSAYTYEICLKGGRWLQMNEHRTSEGGYMCVGADITHLKRSELHLAKREKILQATVTDLSQSRRQLERQSQQLVELAEKYMLEKIKAEAAYHRKATDVTDKTVKKVA